MTSTTADLSFARQLERLGEPLHGYQPELIEAAVRHYLGGASAHLAGRQTGISEHRIRKWIKALGVGRSRDQSAALRIAACAAGRSILAEQRRFTVYLRQPDQDTA